MNENIIDYKIELICKNINYFGLERFDPRDIDDYANKVKNNKLKKTVSIGLQLCEIVNPYIVRRGIKAQKRLYPTTFTFLAESQFSLDNKLPIQYDKDYMRACLDEYYKGKGYWRFNANKYFFPTDVSKEPSMPLYMLCRCNNLLTKLAIRDQIPEWIEISRSSAKYVFDNHIVTLYEDDTESVSYYYNSDEFTINVNAELLDWLTYFSHTTGEMIFREHIERILKAILKEQNVNGSWYYFSRDTIIRKNQEEIVDCHHSATTLYNLIHVYENGVFLDNQTRKKLFDAIANGMKFLCENFFDCKTGKGYVIFGRRRRASTVQYAESLVAVVEFIRVFKESFQVGDYIRLADKMCHQLMRLIKKNGSAPGDIKITSINLNNINWGNGVALYALCAYKKEMVLINE